MSHLGHAQDLNIEWDEDGCTLAFIVSEDGVDHAVVVNPDELYTLVVKEIGPWYAEMAAASREFARRPDPPEETEEPDWDAVRDSERGK